MASSRRRGQKRPSISIAMAVLLALLACLAIAGGASRADVLGQVVVRLAAAIALAVIVLAYGWPRDGIRRAPLWILAAAMALPLLQLVPLPPAIWTALPGRDAFIDAARVAGSAQPWRPIAISPDAAWNAFFSLFVPAAVLLSTAALSDRERLRLPAVLLAMAAYSSVVAVAQLSSGGLDNPFINETIGSGSGIFANPNHQALFLSIGIVAGAAWAITPQPCPPWRMAVAATVALWFLLMIVASGSRTGLALGAVALGGSALMLRHPMAHLVRRTSRRTRWLLAGAAVAIVGILAVLSVTAGRAVSFDRLLQLSTGEDMRSRALPTLFHMVATYMPTGSGFGGFDPLFQMHEPDALLKPTRFNHAHNDYIEVALDGGVLAILLVAGALAWALRASLSAWRRPVTPAARFGAMALLLVSLASVVDYPARTPAIMAVLVIAAMLLTSGTRPDGYPLRPESDGV